jgi:hypothetical protein
LPILAPFSRIAATSPLVDAAQNVESAVAPWRAVRRAVARSANIAAALPGFSAFPVSADATAANTGDENQDPREESDAPLSRHFGVFFSASPTLAGPGFAGFVTDEWTEQRPSRTHSAGLAVNYDSPQAEAPQCLLLCVPPHANAAPWSDAAAARMVAETIAWMKIRAMNTDQKPWPAAVLPNANQVPSKQGTPRIPKRRFRGLDFDVDIVEGAFAVRTALDGDRTWGAAKTELNERIGFHRVKE